MNDDILHVYICSGQQHIFLFIFYSTEKKILPQIPALFSEKSLELMPNAILHIYI